MAEFTTQDGARWKAVLDRVQTTDVPHHPKFGGVILGLYYHGNTGVHTPARAHDQQRGGALVHRPSLPERRRWSPTARTSHVMLLSHTRPTGDYALECWDCSKNAVDELQLQITPGPGQPKFAAPGGFLFVNWERSSARRQPFHAPSHVSYSDR